MNKNKKRLCNGCNVVEYTINKPFTCFKCGYKTIIEKDKNNKDIQIN